MDFVAAGERQTSKKKNNRYKNWQAIQKAVNGRNETIFKEQEHVIIRIFVKCQV